jgi:hypothetical protein
MMRRGSASGGHVARRYGACPEALMATTDLTGLLTAGALAKQLGVSDGKVKKALKELAIEPKAKKGVCAYYGKDALTKLKPVVAK